MLFAVVVVLAGMFALGAVCAGIEYTTMGQHIGAGLAIALIDQFGTGFVLGPLLAAVPASRWLAFPLSAAVIFVFAWPLSLWVYSASARQATIIAATAAIGTTLLKLLMYWAMR